MLLGYRKLAFSVIHVWYLKHLPSYVVNLLDKPFKELEGRVLLRKNMYHQYAIINWNLMLYGERLMKIWLN